MPRKPRVYVAGIASHIIQRGNDRQACFFTDEDYQFYLECLFDASRKYKVSCHAYVLMTNHVHLLLTPATAEGVSQVMQSIGRRYVQYINKTYRRSGTLWEGRHKASLVDVNNYLFTCYRYIELNPVRAGMVNHPSEYRWSSFMANAHGHMNCRITPHELFESLGADAESARKSYREMFEADLGVSEIHQIRNAAQFSLPLGNTRFNEKIEEMIGRKLGYARRGRPGIKEEAAIYIA